MKLDDFITRRQQERNWLNINGFENGDPETNGEMRVLEQFWKNFDLFIDVGANEGMMTQKVLSLNEAVEIICFEPNPELQKTLSAEFGSMKNVSVEKVALSSRKARAKLLVHPKDLGTSSLFVRTGMMPSFTKAMKEVSVEVRLLNSYLRTIERKRKNQKAGIFIKIDVEGSELSVLRGASRVLKLECPLFVQFEYSYGWQEAGQNLKDAFHLLDTLGFFMLRITPIGLEHVRFFTRDMENLSYCNYLAVKNVDAQEVLGNPKRIATRTGTTDFYPFIIS